MTFTFRASLAGFLSLFLTVQSAWAEPISAPDRTETILLESEQLGESRQVDVLLPENFEKGKPYPILFVLDVALRRIDFALFVSRRRVAAEAGFAQTA